jgi:tRNA nucleotidyltransferase/poly(A) polymerase
MQAVLDIPNIKLPFPTYIVGGWVRDKLIDANSKPKDLDLCMVAPTFADMVKAVEDIGGEVFLATEGFLTLRCNIPGLGAVDVALARKDGEYSDGRRPDVTHIADCIEDDLARRDATVNAIAIDLADGTIIDPFHGVDDLNMKLIRAVGNAEDRIKEDYLRMLRYFRFSITKGFNLHQDIHRCMIYMEFVSGLKNVSQERIREELFKCFKADTMLTLSRLEYYSMIKEQVFSNNNMWLMPTTKQ